MVHSFKWNYAGCILDPLQNNYIYLQSSVSVLQMYNNVLDHQIKFLLHPTFVQYEERRHILQYVKIVNVQAVVQDLEV